MERIQLAAQHLLQLIEEVLTFSRVEANRERLDIEPTTLRQLAREVCAIIEPLAHERGLRFDERIHDPELMLHTDARKVRQVLLNLLGNAVKFTEQGEVSLDAAATGKGVCFTVRDSGIGIATDDLTHIFEPFWQAETEIHARVSGTGLGLPVTRQLVHLLGGRIRVESTPGQGTTFRVELPLEAPIDES